jgi:dihydrofolate reductase
MSRTHGAILMIAAIDNAYGLGYKGGLPWGRNPRDMAHFKRYTMGKNLVMGRKTFESVGPLPGRHTFVLSRSGGVDGEGYSYPASLPGIDMEIDQTLVVCGGAEIYKLYAPYARDFSLTVIEGEYQSDTFLDIDLRQWEWEGESHIMKHGLTFMHGRRKQ